MVLAISISRFLYSFVINVWRLQIAPSCEVVGQLASQYGVVCAMCICWVAVGFSMSVHVLGSVSAISFPIMPECAVCTYFV